MKKVLSYIFIVIAPFQLSAQTILVPNPGFKSYTSCPHFPPDGSIVNAAPWFQSWTNFNSSDFFHTCDTMDQMVSVPYNFGGYQWPHTGNGYAGILCYYSSNPNPPINSQEFLESIALNCTQKGGNAVFVARTLLTLLDSTNSSYNDSCYMQESRIRDTDENPSKQVQINVQPNPANDFILISIVGESENTNFDFEIINTDGKLVERHNSLNAQRVSINTTMYTSGIYTIKVSIEGKTLTSKFIITH